MSTIILHTDNIRRREVDRLRGSHVAVAKATSILTALLDLVAWRLEARCATISLIDHKYQHLLATSTTAYHHKVEHFNKDLWHNTWPGRDDALVDDIPCGRTIKNPPIRDDCTIFTVWDMSIDPIYCQLPLVSGPPFIRFYAGTPLRTSSGIVVGTIFVLDDKARDRISQEHMLFLEKTAQNAIETLENFQSAEELTVNEKMLRGFTTLFNNESVTTGDFAVSDEIRARADRKSYGTRLPTKESLSVSKDSISDSSPPLFLSPLTLDMKEGMYAGQTVDHPSQEVQNGKDSLSLGARILHAALQMDDSGGVLLLGVSADLKHSATGNFVAEEFKMDAKKSKHEDQFDALNVSDILQKAINTGKTYPSDSNGNDVPSDDSILSKSRKGTTILGSCTSVSRADDNRSLLFSPLQSEELVRLITAFPAGNLWSFTAGPTFVLPESTDALLLTTRFPGAHQVMFVPLDEMASGFTTGCFIWSTSRNTKWRQHLELNFCITFCACLMAKMARIDVVAAEKRRNAFVSSISHELRSPLHGILASADLLSETRCDVFQKSLVDTVDSCGRTLLDTINHVLDYSKMSSFGSSGSEFYEQSFAQSIPLDRFGNASSEARAEGLITVPAETNIAAVCEEVVEGLVLGQHSREHPSFTPSTDFPPNSTVELPWARDGDRVFSSSESRQTDDSSGKVEIILRIEKQNWRFVTQPGALRRIIMNIFGNAIKYTEKGHIKVELHTLDLPQYSPSQDLGHGNNDVFIVVLKITDTGKGISKAFLRDHLYSPFAQEDSLAAGTGLGLSLVRSIVCMLDGTIDVESDEGRGTEVTVRLPMRRKAEAAASQLLPNPGVMIDRREIDHIAVLHGVAKGKTIALFGFDSVKKESSTFKAVGETLAYYVTEWYGLNKTSIWSSSSESDILIADEVDLPALLAHGPKFPGSRAGPLLVILCSDAVKYGQTTVYAAGGGIIEFVTKPLGPYKLAKALYRCLQRAVDVKQAAPEVAATAPSTSFWKESLSVLNASSSQEIRTTRFSPEFGTFSQAEPIETSYVSNSDRPEDEIPQLVPALTTESHRPPPTILLVDDNTINLRLLEMFVKRCQCGRVDTAINGQLAAQAVERSAGYDLIFMDISMPVLNGFEATRLIRATEAERTKVSGEPALVSRRSVIIALTGLVSVRDRTEAYAAGVDLYLTKPISLRDLKELLNRWNTYGPEGFLSTEGNTDRVRNPTIETRE